MRLVPRSIGGRTPHGARPIRHLGERAAYRPEPAPPGEGATCVGGRGAAAFHPVETSRRVRRRVRRRRVHSLAHLAAWVSRLRLVAAGRFWPAQARRRLGSGVLARIGTIGAPGRPTLHPSRMTLRSSAGETMRSMQSASAGSGVRHDNESIETSGRRASDSAASRARVGGKVQCRLCGQWLSEVGSRHVKRAHGITLAEYYRAVD